MKKAQQANILVAIVAVAFLYKGVMDSNTTLLIVGILLLVSSGFRYLLFKQAGKVNLYQKAGIDSILRYLDTDPILYVHMKTVYKRGHCKILYEENDGILLYDEKSDVYLGTANTLAGAKDIVYLLPQDYHTFVGHDVFFDTLMQSAFPVKEYLHSYNHVYAKKDKVNIPEHPYQFAYLDETYLDVIKQHYDIGYLCNDAYLLPRIKEGMLGIFDGDTLMGFVGVHSSGAMGMMEVFPEHQGKHVGTILQSEFTNRLLEQKKRPIYTQVNSKNEASLHLQAKLGYAKAKQTCGWYFS